MKKNYFSVSSFLSMSGLGKCLFAALFMGLVLALPQVLNAQSEFYIRTDTVNATTGAQVFGSLNNVRMWTSNVDGTSGGTSRFPKNFTEI